MARINSLDKLSETVLRKKMMSAPTLSWLKTYWILSALLACHISSIFSRLGISAGKGMSVHSIPSVCL